MRQPELTLEFKEGDRLWDGLNWLTVTEVVLHMGYPIVLFEGTTKWTVMDVALRWYAERDGECIRNPWSKP